MQVGVHLHEPKFQGRVWLWRVLHHLRTTAQMLGVSGSSSLAGYCLAAAAAAALIVCMEAIRPEDESSLVRDSQGLQISSAHQQHRYQSLHTWAVTGNHFLMTLPHRTCHRCHLNLQASTMASVCCNSHPPSLLLVLMSWTLSSRYTEPPSQQQWQCVRMS